MISIIQEITVEVAKPNFFQAIVAKQFDSNSRFLKATLVQDKEKITVASTSTVTINAKRNDGAEKSFAGEINEDGTVTVPLTYWMLELNGRLDCDISIFGADDSKLTSTTFTVEVEKASCSSDNVADAEENDIIIVQAKDVVSKAVLEIAIDSHEHNDVYYLKSEVNAFLSNKSDVTHTHSNFKGFLTTEDDCDNLFEDGVYVYSTDVAQNGLKNAPFPNGSVIEVFGADSTSTQKIQRAYRYGEPGYSAFRSLFGSQWSKWSYFADYVVEEGTTSGWTYRKWFSGKMEAWGNLKATVTEINTSSAVAGLIVISADKIKLPTDMLYGEDKNEYCSLQARDYRIFGSGMSAISNNNLWGKFITTNSAVSSDYPVDSTNFPVHAHIIGKWK